MGRGYGTRSSCGWWWGCAGSVPPADAADRIMSSSSSVSVLRLCAMLEALLPSLRSDVVELLRVPLSSQNLSDILPRLVDTIADAGEDMQGYVTEIMLTLESAVDNLNSDFHSMDFMKEIFLSTPNLNKEPRLEIKKSATVALRQNAAHHFRSTSHSLSALIARKAVVSLPPGSVKDLVLSGAAVMGTPPIPIPGAVSIPSGVGIPPESIQSPRSRSQSGDTEQRKNSSLSRSRSAQSLKDIQGPEDRLSLLMQMFWIAVSLLESDYEYEFMHAVELLSKLLQHIQPDRPECRDGLDKILKQIKWYNFPGVQALLLKGCTSSSNYDSTIKLISKLTHCINAPAVDPLHGAGFPMNVIALLPLLVEQYEEATPVCTQAADSIAQMCMEQTSKLDNLATVMQLYSHGTFGKDKFQWTKCVVKYLFDVYMELSPQMVAFLVEVLEKGPASMQGSVLQVLHCIVHYIDVTASPFHSLNGELLRVVSKFVETQKWSEALKILKFCVTRSSSLSAPPSSMTSSMHEMSISSLGGHTSFAEADVSFKKELPGRTMDFTFDMSQVSVIALSRQLGVGADGTATLTKERDKDSVSIHTASSTLEHPHGPQGWKCPHLSQKRVRERLVNLLNIFGQSGQVVGLRPSSSETILNKVIFSQSSDTIERQASKSTSSEEMSQAEGLPGDDSSMERQLRVFDFLDEIELDDGDQFNQGLLQRGSMEDFLDDKDLRSSAESPIDGSSDDEIGSVSPVDEYPIGCPVTSSTVTLQNAGMTETLRPSSISASSPSLASEHSEEGEIIPEDPDVDDPDTGSPSSASPSFSNMAVVSIQSDEIDDVWGSHVQRVMTDDSAAYAINTFHLFARLFQETQRKLQNITKEACYFLSRTEKVKLLAVQLAATLDLINTSVECPLVYADMETLTASHLLERLRFGILEINENYETYMMRKNHAAQVLEGLKSAIKLQSLGKQQSQPSPGDQVELSMSWALYHLNFQFLQLFESYCKLVLCLAQAYKPPEIADLSTSVMELKESLQQAQLEVDLDTDSLPAPPDDSISRETAEKLLMECLRNEHFATAVHVMRHLRLRKLFPGDMFGVNPSDEVEGLLFLFCKCQAEAKPGVVAITRADHDLSEVHSRLIDIKIQLTQTHSATSSLPSDINPARRVISQASSDQPDSPTTGTAEDPLYTNIEDLGLQCTTVIRIETADGESGPETSTL